MYYYLFKEQAKLKNATMVSLLLVKKTLKNTFISKKNLKNTSLKLNLLKTL